MNSDRQDGAIWGKSEGDISSFPVPSFSIHSSFSNASTIINVSVYRTKICREIAACSIVVWRNTITRDGGSGDVRIPTPPPILPQQQASFRLAIQPAAPCR